MVLGVWMMLMAEFFASIAIVVVATRTTILVADSMAITTAFPTTQRRTTLNVTLAMPFSHSKLTRMETHAVVSKSV